MIINGWFDWAIPFSAPAFSRTIAQGGKLISTTPTPVEWQTFHSQEGGVGIDILVRNMACRWTELTQAERQVVLAGLDKSFWSWRNPSRPNTAWHGTNLRGCGPRGVLVQHAPITARLAHGHASNPHGPGWEAEGVFSQPLDEGQEAVVERILDECSEHYGRTYSRDDLTIREHRDSGPTACPSERYTAHWAERKATMSKLDDLIAVVVGNGMTTEMRPGEAAFFPPGTVVGDTVTLTTSNGDPLGLAVKRGYSFAMGLGLARQDIATDRVKLNKHLDAPHNGGGGTIPGPFRAEITPLED